jgi:SAM-dependent methyltransferase
VTPEQVKAGQALYSRPFLSIYDRWALRLNCRVTWRCPVGRMLELYDRHVTANHLDVGVGTGYFLDRCRFPSPNPRLVLMDLNPNCLDVTAKRVARYDPEIYRRNVLDPIEIDGPGFDSIGMLNLLHCLPGNMETKGAAFDHLKALLNPGGVLFGSTLLYRGVRRGPLATLTFNWVNRMGAMTNKQDDAEGLRRALGQRFAETSVELIGCEALFWARQVKETSADSGNRR